MEITKQIYNFQMGQQLLEIVTIFHILANIQAANMVRASIFLLHKYIYPIHT